MVQWDHHPPSPTREGFRRPAGYHQLGVCAISLGFGMAFVVPAFPLTCNIWTNGAGPPAPPRVTSVCQLRWGPSRTAQNYPGLLLPAHTDIRSWYHTTGRDIVEVPAGSGRFYVCIWMDDVALGFPNVHREATLEWFSNFLTPTP